MTGNPTRHSGFMEALRKCSEYGAAWKVRVRSSVIDLGNDLGSTCSCWGHFAEDTTGRLSDLRGGGSGRIWEPRFLVSKGRPGGRVKNLTPPSPPPSHPHGRSFSLSNEPMVSPWGAFHPSNMSLLYLAPDHGFIW